jgi:pimeloyl-ACP methyl ester carboxylesterase
MTSSPVLRQRIVRSGGRRVHLWTGGQGPAVILIHGSPGNAWLVQPIAERLARYFCVYAVDSPGFGGSDAIGVPVESVAQLAAAYRELMDCIGLATVLVYGTHSGAAIGLELAYRHPERVAGFVLEGVPAFTEEERRPLLAPQYLMPMDPDVLGGHYARAWTRFHDQFVWFPWYRREPAHLNEASAGSAAEIHLWVEMYFQAMRHDYRPAYRAVISYGDAALTAARAVRVPGVYMAERSDMLFPHLDRLPPLHDGQRIERVMEPGEVPGRIEAALRALPKSAGGITLDDAPVGDEYFHDLPGGQILVRAHAYGSQPAGAQPADPQPVAAQGDPRTPVLLLHDAPGAGRQLLDLYRELAAFGTVLLPDLPGCGESDPLGVEPLGDEPRAVDARNLAGHADALAALLAARADGAVHVYGVGFGAALALELNVRHPERVAALTLTGLLRASGEPRRDMIGRLAPPITLNDDGSHWYRTWLMLRNSLVRWPWYAREPGALRRQPIEFEPAHLHTWTCDVMRQWAAYHHLIDAVLQWNPQQAIAFGRDKLTVAIDPLHALHASDVEWAGEIKSITLPSGIAQRAHVIASLTP